MENNRDPNNANIKAWNIEKTNFPFVQELKTTPKKTKDPHHFACFGDGAVSFLGFLYEDNPYTRSEMYDLMVKDANGNNMSVVIYSDYFGSVDYFDPLNTQKINKARADQAYIAVLTDQESLRNVYQFSFPLIFKSTPTITRQFMVLHYIRDDTYQDVTPEQVKAAAEFIGATRIITLDRQKFWKCKDRRKEIEELCGAIALQSPVEIKYTDSSVVDKFSMLALVTFGDLKQIQNQSNLLDPNFTDPIGNNLLHYASSNSDDVFYYMVDMFPELLNMSSSYETPVHKYIQIRKEKIDWDRLWKLPIKFSKKNKYERTCLMLIQCATYGHVAFEALIKNEAAWTKARKHHKRKIILTKVVETLLHNWKGNDAQLQAKVEFFVKHGASVHHHEKKSLLHTAIKHKRLHIVTKLLELGAKIREEDIVASWDTYKESMIRFMLNRPEMNLLSQEKLDYIAKLTVEIGLTDILQALIRKGCKVDLSMNESGKVVTANLLAQMLCNNIIMPLKYQCVDRVYETVAYKNRKQNKDLSLSGEEAQINWDRELKSYPEEIRDLFRRKELWRWALFLEDEERREKVIKLYHATNINIKDPTNKHTIELHYGSVTFCFSFDGHEQFLWLGDLKSKSPKHRMFYKEYCETTGGGYNDWTFDRKVDNKEVLEEVMKTCGWDLEDVYVFLHILHTSYITEVDSAYLSSCFFTSYVYEFLKPPQWYADFVQQIYGLTHPDRPMNSYSEY